LYLSKEDVAFMICLVPSCRGDRIENFRSLHSAIPLLIA
jgi:hypothetical protein